jgi:hypothetical protein
MTLGGHPRSTRGQTSGGRPDTTLERTGNVPVPAPDRGPDLHEEQQCEQHDG